MNMLILLTLLQIVSSNVAYNFTCPSSAHWKIRAKSLCEPTRNYTCLFDVTFRVNVYRERCSRPRILAEGYKYVFQPNLNRATCSAIRYQPFIFDTNGYSDCTYQKSFCSSLGQETYEIGNTSVDRLCTCNTNKGYSFLSSSKQLCNCNPLTEDCSCYLGINQSNKTDRMKDIKCYDDVNLTRSPYLGDMFNNSRTIKIIEFDNFKYNLNYPTNKYRIKAAASIGILLLSYFLPDAINQLSEKDKIRYITLMQSSEIEKRYNVRIMIVGKESAGKTCLLRRLLKEDITDVTSTDGVDIVVRRCKINIADGKWTIGKEMYDDKVGRIKRALNPNAEDDRNTQNMQVEATNNMNIRQGDEKSTYNKGITTNIKIHQENSDDSNESSSLFMPEDSTNTAIVNLDNKEVTNESSSLVTPEDFTTDDKVNLDNKQNESSLLVMPEDLMSHVFSKSTVNAPFNIYALCELWDFAGQKEFYATHQAFLTSSAVYLVVADMKDDISTQGLGQCFADFQNIGEYVDFWFDSIHCHRTADIRARNGHFDPPIVLVFTGKDIYEKEADLKKRKKELNDQLDQVLGLKSKYHHLHKKCYLSNLTDTDEEFVKLRHAISETARKMDNWGNAFPLKWILLEHLIEINKNEGKILLI